MGERSAAQVILPVAIAGLALLTHFGHYTSSNAFDFYQFWMFGQAARNSAPANIYDTTARARIGDEFYQQAVREGVSQRQRDVAQQRRDAQAISSPLLYTLFGLCSGGHFEIDYFNFQLLAAGAVVVGVLLLAAAMGYPWTIGCLWLGALLTWFGPFFSDVEVGNVNRLQLLTVGAYCWLQMRDNIWLRDVCGGIVLALLIAFKPNLALVPVLLVGAWIIRFDFDRLLRQLAGMAGGVVIAIALTAWYFGSASCWTDWLGALRDTTQNMQMHSAGNVSFAWWLTGRMNADVWLPLTAAMSLLVLVAVAISRRAKDTAVRDVMIVIAAIAISLLGSPLTWHHYLVLAAPLWMIMLMPAARCAALMRTAGALVLIAFGYARLMRDFVGMDRTFELLVPIWWLTIAVPLLAIVITLARPQPAGD